MFALAWEVAKANYGGFFGSLAATGYGKAIAAMGMTTAGGTGGSTAGGSATLN
jgi:hypothetical protein